MKRRSSILLMCVAALVFSRCTKPNVSVAPSNANEGSPRMSTLAGPIYYVSLSGHDTDNGTSLSHSWRTIQYAANNIPAGATVIISGGIYYESVVIPTSCSGTSEATRTIFKSAAGETAILDGQWDGTSLGAYNAQIQMAGDSYITFQGIKVQNCKWYGFAFTGTTSAPSSHITIDGCTVFKSGSAGIYFSKSSYANVTNNKVQKACLYPSRFSNGYGTLECITALTSDNYSVIGNEVWDTPYTDAGGEGIDAQTPGVNGIIANNYVHDLGRLGIYVDAGSSTAVSNIKIYNNVVFKCSAGIAIAGERGGNVQDVYIYNNIIELNTGCGVIINGAVPNYTQGFVKNIHVVHNTFYSNATAAGSNYTGDLANFNTSPSSSGIYIQNNIFYNQGTTYNFSLYINLPAIHTIDHNLFYTFKSKTGGGYSATGPTDVLGNPGFQNTSMGNFRLNASSPAIGKGLAYPLPSITPNIYLYDDYGHARGTRPPMTGDSGWDMGALQYF